MTVSLQDAARTARVKTMTYVTGGTGGKEKKVHHIAFERGETTVVYSRSKQELADLLVAWSLVKNVSLIQFAGRRGFVIKTTAPESTKKETNGSHNATSERTGTPA